MILNNNLDKVKSTEEMIGFLEEKAHIQSIKVVNGDKYTFSPNDAIGNMFAVRPKNKTSEDYGFVYLGSWREDENKKGFIGSLDDLEILFEFEQEIPDKKQKFCWTCYRKLPRLKKKSEKFEFSNNDEDKGVIELRPYKN
ncbi:hypothetical protein AMR42_14670 [Limnothrix sp. PR1529]|nr:hypothetical protein BCR12_02390 [Limnothrix sp. P13C2]PIB07096.1 hypothetical protein AMR42_14670 [Limnothrix sp. PR1529]